VYYNDKVANEYEVRHPRWEQYRLKSYTIEVDFSLVYGERFSFLNSEDPVSVMLAEESEISVDKRRIIVF